MNNKGNAILARARVLINSDAGIIYDYRVRYVGITLPFVPTMTVKEDEPKTLKIAYCGLQTGPHFGKFECTCKNHINIILY
jgi:hypothetical protein